MLCWGEGFVNQEEVESSNSSTIIYSILMVMYHTVSSTSQHVPLAAILLTTLTDILSTTVMHQTWILFCPRATNGHLFSWVLHNPPPTVFKTSAYCNSKHIHCSRVKWYSTLICLAHEEPIELLASWMATSLTVLRLAPVLLSVECQVVTRSTWVSDLQCCVLAYKNSGRPSATWLGQLACASARMTGVQGKMC